MAAAPAHRPLIGAVLIGGAGRRMGGDKARVTVGHHTMLERTAATLAGVCDELIIVARAGQSVPAVSVHVPVRVVRDRVPGAGPLGGLDAALAACRSDRLVVAAVDMPLVSEDVLRLLLTALEGTPSAAAAVLGTVRGPSPFPATYRAAAGPVAAALLSGGARRMRALLDRLPVLVLDEEQWRAVDPRGRSLANLNEPADLAVVSGG